MEITITERHINTERAYAPYVAQSPDVYAGNLDGKRFFVEIRPDAAPVWHDDLDDDERADVLAAIDSPAT